VAPPPAPGPPRHRHLDADEACYVLAGTLHLEVEGEPARKLEAGDYELIPRGTWHVLSNAGPDPARFLIILNPPGFEGYWAELAERMAQLGGPLDPDERRMTNPRQVKARHGVRYIGGESRSNSYRVLNAVATGEQRFRPAAAD